MDNGIESAGEGSAREQRPDETIPLARPIVNEPATHRLDEILLRNQSRKEAWSDVGLFVLIVVLLSIAGETWLFTGYRHSLGVTGELSETARVQIERAVLIPVLGWRTLVVVVVVAAVVRRRGGTAGSVGVTSEKLPANLLIAVGSTVAIAVTMVILVLLLRWCFPSLDRQLEANAGRIMDRVPPYSPATFAGLTLMIGLYEELVFRGFLMPRLRRATGSWAIAVLLSTLVFSSLHLFDQVPAALILVTVMSLILSLVTIWRRSIVPAVVAHALFNFGMFLQLRWAAGDQWQ